MRNLKPLPEVSVFSQMTMQKGTLAGNSCLNNRSAQPFLWESTPRQFVLFVFLFRVWVRSRRISSWLHEIQGRLSRKKNQKKSDNTFVTGIGMATSCAVLTKPRSRERGSLFVRALYYFNTVGRTTTPSFYTHGWWSHKSRADQRISAYNTGCVCPKPLSTILMRMNPIKSIDQFITANIFTQDTNSDTPPHELYKTSVGCSLPSLPSWFLSVHACQGTYCAR